MRFGLILLACFLCSCDDELYYADGTPWKPVDVPIRFLPGAIAARDMNARQWAEYIGSQRAQYYREGQTAYNTGTGFWLGMDDGTPKFSIGDSSGNNMTWDGQVLRVDGDLTGGFVAYKTTATARDNTTTLTADPDLQIPLSASAVYKLELQLMFKGEAATSGNQGFNFAMTYTGAFSVEGRATGYKIVNLTGDVHVGSSGAFPMSSPIPGGVAPISVGLQDQDTFHATWLVVTNTAGTLSVDWAQAVSSADDTSVLQGSYLISTRLSQ